MRKALIVLLFLLTGPVFADQWSARLLLPDRAQPAANSISISVSTHALQFYQEGRPGLIDYDQNVDLRVRSANVPWSVLLRATPLAGNKGWNAIDPSRLFVRSNQTQSAPTGEAGEGFVGLGSDVVIAGVTTPNSRDYVTPLEFRLLTTWSDAPGVYNGNLIFTAIVNP